MIKVKIRNDIIDWPVIGMIKVIMGKWLPNDWPMIGSSNDASTGSGQQIRFFRLVSISFSGCEVHTSIQYPMLRKQCAHHWFVYARWIGQILNGQCSHWWRVDKFCTTKKGALDTFGECKQSDRQGSTATKVRERKQLWNRLTATGGQILSFALNSCFSTDRWLQTLQT